LKPLPWIARQDSGRDQARNADAFAEVQRRLGSFSLALRMGAARQPGPLAHAEEGRLLVHQCAGRAGQDALHRVAGEVAGLLARLDVGHADADAVNQVASLIACTGQTCTHWPHLMHEARKSFSSSAPGGRRRLVRAYTSGRKPEQCGAR
jgi:hypothetical protein